MISVIFYSDLVRNPQLLTNWATENGFECRRLVASQTTTLLEEAGQAQRVVIVEHPFEDESDVELLVSFLAKPLPAGGGRYYAPRPNSHLSVDGAALVVIHQSPKSALRWRLAIWKRRLVQIMRYIYHTLPKSVQGPAKQLAKAYRNEARRKSKPSCIKAEVNQVTAPSLPDSLHSLPLAWEEWTPSRPLLMRDVVDRAAIFFPYPRGIHVAVLNKCNLSCVMCPYHSPKYKAHHTSDYFDSYKSMTMETFSRIAEYAAKNKISLQFGQIEEPLMHKGIFDFISHASKLGVPHMHITTNGTLLNAEKADRLLASGINSVMFSVDAATADTYRTIRGSDLTALEKNISYFVGKARQHGIKTWVSFILQPQSRQEREDFLHKWRKIGVDHVTFYVLTDHDLNTGAFIRTEEIYEKGKRYPCASPWMQSVVFPNGEVSLCCKAMTDVGWRDVVSVGSLAETSYDEVWVSPRYSLVREELMNNRFDNFPICQDCEIWSASISHTEITADYTRSYNETMETYSFHGDRS